MQVEHHYEARGDVLEAAEWYESQREWLGLQFLQAFDAAVAIVAEAPERWPELREGVRRYHMRRFPYAIQYRIDSDRLLILTVKHHMRHPDFGSERK